MKPWVNYSRKSYISIAILVNHKLNILKMKFIYFGLLLFTLELSSLNSYSQEVVVPIDTAKSTAVIFEEFDYANINLPPVSEFLDAATSYSDVRFYEERVKEQEELLKISKKEWLKYFRIQGNYQYGTNYDLTSQNEGSLYPPVAVSTRRVQSWYNAGANLSIPLDDLFSRKNKNNVAKARLAQSEYESQRTLESRQILILETYNEVIKNIALMKVKAEAVALYNAQMKISESDFINGRIDIITLSLERSRRAEAIVKYQESKAALLNAVTILELLTKIKIIKK